MPHLASFPGILFSQALPQDISVFDLFRNFIESQVDSAILTYSGGGGTPSDSPTGGKLHLAKQKDYVVELTT